jgi:quercetin dioxygenase-like cupin family protein
VRSAFACGPRSRPYLYTRPKIQREGCERKIGGAAEILGPAGASARSKLVVYFEVEPGDRLAVHTDSAEEILYVVSGEAETQIGDERGRITAGDLAVIPAMVPHSLASVGEETLNVVGFFSESEVISTFDEPVQPMGVSVLNQGAPAPAPA